MLHLQDFALVPAARTVRTVNHNLLVNGDKRSGRYVYEVVMHQIRKDSIWSLAYYSRQKALLADDNEYSDLYLNKFRSMQQLTRTVAFMTGEQAHWAYQQSMYEAMYRDATIYLVSNCDNSKRSWQWKIDRSFARLMDGTARTRQAAVDAINDLDPSLFVPKASSSYRMGTLGSTSHASVGV